MSNAVYLRRILEGRLAYFREVGQILAEREGAVNCLTAELLAIWGGVQEPAKAARTENELRWAAKVMRYACATADHLLSGNSDAAVWTLLAMTEAYADNPTSKGQGHK